MILQPTSTLHREQWLPASLSEVFSFFSEARNLDRITPPWLHFKVLGQTDAKLRAGALIHYKLAWYGIPLSWTTRIDEWCPPILFVDVQLKGPYRLWRHTHTFEPRAGGTMIRDTVDYGVPMGALGNFCAGWLVQRDVKRIFDHRAKQIHAIFKTQLPPRTQSKYGSR